MFNKPWRAVWWETITYGSESSSELADSIVNNGWILRYTHANVASFFFIFVYLHVGRGLYYSSYKHPRVLVWSIGVIILILMMAIAFLGYVLPYGQMSLWGSLKIAQNVYLHLNPIKYEECLDIFYQYELYNLNFFISFIPVSNLNFIRIKAKLRIGPHNQEILSIIFGSLLGDGYAEFRSKGNGTRINFYQEDCHVSYLLWIHQRISELGYCNSKLPLITTRLGKKGVVRKIIRFRTWTYSSLNWIYDSFYKENKKCVPILIQNYLTPLALAIWIMDDGRKIGEGLKLATNSFSYSDCNFLVKVLYENFKLKATVQSASIPNQNHIYIWKESMSLLRDIVKPYVHPSMKYKLNYK